MADMSCSRCAQQASVPSLFDLNGKIYCANCVRTAAAEAQAAGQPSSYIPLIQKSICPRCNTYIGDAPDAVQIRNFRFCAACATKIRDWNYPLWLKAALACMLVLLAFALIHGRKYFHAGREMYVGERLVKQGRYAEALPHLKETLRTAPQSDKAALLAAKAALLSGDVDSAGKALNGHNGGYFEHADEPEFKEVNALWKRATTALEKAGKATELAQQDGKEVEAAQLMHAAAAGYPELPGLALAAEVYDEGAAFARKDYDAFVAITKRQWAEHPAPGTAASVASALACKYAVTGDATYRQQSEEMLAKAQQMAQGNAEDLKALDEYFPRIRYRLDHREIITRTEYDRRFRNGKAASK